MAVRSGTVAGLSLRLDPKFELNWGLLSTEVLLYFEYMKRYPFCGFMSKVLLFNALF